MGKYMSPELGFTFQCSMAQGRASGGVVSTVVTLQSQTADDDTKTNAAGLDVHL